MYTLFGIPTQNTLKAAYVLDALGATYEYKFVNLAKGEQKQDSFLKLNPVGKVPTLKHNDFSVFESNTICRYIARTENSSLYPTDTKKQVMTDQWLDYLTNLLGRWLSTLSFEKILKPMLGMRTADLQKCEEALNFINQQMPPVEKFLSENKYFGGQEPTIADFVAFAYLEQTGPTGYDLSKYPSVKAWLSKMEQSDSIKKTKSKVKF
jgi:glutathione S-transferase